MTRPGLPKLVATDLDGTLVRSDDTVSAYTHEVLDRVRAADYLVMAGGGRVVDQSDPLGPVVLRDERLPAGALGRIVTALEAEVGDLTVMVEALDGHEEPLWGDLDPAWRYPEAVRERARADCLGCDVIKAFARSVHHDVDALLAVARRVVPAELATVTQAGLGFVEITPPGVDKGSGLAVVAQSLGVDPADVLVFGDMPNDLPMFAWAGWSRVAVANAHAELRAAADELTLANDDDGVAVYLDRLLSR